MRIAIQTWGSEGDILPFVALAAELVRRGHRVTLAATSVEGKSYESHAARYGFRSLMVGKHPEIAANAGERIARARTPIGQVEIILKEGFYPSEDEMFAAADDLCGDSDLLIGHVMMYPSSLAARAHGTPYVSVNPCHAFVPTAHAAPYPFSSLGKTMNRALWRVGDLLADRMLLRHVREFCARHSLPPVGPPVREALNSDRLNLIAVSRVFATQWPDWTDSVVTGAFLLPEEPVAEAPPALADFLDAGPPPVYMSFGSVQQFLPYDCVKIFAEAARRAGCRAIVRADSSGRPTGSAEGDVFYIGYLRHDLFLSKCAAAVHHGGAGTTHAVLHAGLPAIVVDHLCDQPIWARELARLGVLAGRISGRRLSAKRLAGLLGKLSANFAMKSRAEDLAEIMRGERGTGAAADRIEALAKKAE